MEFDQCPWLEKYITLNTEKRKLAKSTFEKDFFKLCNNSVYGKVLQNDRKRSDIRLVGDQKKAELLLARPEFESYEIINEYLSMIKLRQTSVYWNKPTSVGFCVLELSKLLMYQFHYDYIVKKYGKNATLLFTDTDSLCYEITTPDIYKDMQADKDLFDTSDYPKDHPLYSPVNSKVIGKMKDECNGKPPLEFVGLRSKMYSLLLQDDNHKCTVKGVQRAFLKKRVTHQDYLDCLQQQTRTQASFHNIVSKNHNVTTAKITKIGLSAYDDKRFLLRDSPRTLAYGHKDCALYNS